MKINRGTISRFVNTLRDWPTVVTVCGWAAVLWIVVFQRLGYAGLLDPDEAHYGQLTREMIRHREWMVPLLDGRPFIDKPALFHWLQIVSTRLLGASELALRLPSAVATVSLVLTVRWLGTSLYDRRTGNIAALMFATVPLTYALSSIGIFDMTFVAFLFGGVSCLLVGLLQRRPRLLYAAYALFALAIMTKGPVGLVLVGVWLAAAAVFGVMSREMRRSLRWGIPGLLITCSLSAPWFLWMWSRFGPAFVRDYVVAGNLWYFTKPDVFSTRDVDHTFYLRSVIGGLFPWSFVTLAAGIDRLRPSRFGQQRPAATAWLWLWTITVVGFFTAARFKVDYYIFPAAPACCLLAADQWKRAVQDADLSVARPAIVLAGVILLASGLLMSVTLMRLNLDLALAALSLPITLAIGGSVMVWQWCRTRRTLSETIAAPVLTLLAVYCLVAWFGLPLLDRSRPTAPLGRWIAAQTEQDVVVGIYGVDDWRASIRYYTDRQVLRLSDATDLKIFLETQPDAYVMMLDADLSRLREAGLPLEEVASRPAIVGRTGKYLRSQVWGRLVVASERSPRSHRAARSNQLGEPRTP